MKKLWKCTKIIEVLNRCMIQNFDLLWKNYGTMEKNYGTMEKIMVLYRKLWNFDLLWKKLWFYGKNYGIIVNYSSLL